MDKHLKLRYIISESEKVIKTHKKILCKAIDDILSEDNSQAKEIFEEIKKKSDNFCQILDFAKNIKTPCESIRQEFFDILTPFVMGIKRYYDKKHGSAYVLDFRLTMVNGQGLTISEIFSNLDEMFDWIWSEYFKNGEISMNDKSCSFDVYCNIKGSDCAECVDVEIGYHKQELRIIWGNAFERYMPFYLKNHLYTMFHSN